MKCEDCENYKPNKLTKARQHRREVLVKIARLVCELNGTAECTLLRVGERSMSVNEINTRPETLNYRDDDYYYVFSIPPVQEDEK